MAIDRIQKQHTFIIDQHQLKVKMRFRVFDHGTYGYDCVTMVWIQMIYSAI